MKSFDPTKPFQTRDGRKARIICTDRKSKTHPIIALVQDSDGDEEHVGYTRCGQLFTGGETDFSGDLINIPQKLTAEIWVNFYPEGTAFGHRSQNEANAEAVCDRIACKKFILEAVEGEGL